MEIIVNTNVKICKILKFDPLYDTRVKRSKIRCKLACKRIFELGTRQKHEKAARLGRILNVFEGAKRPVDVCSAPTATE